MKIQIKIFFLFDIGLKYQFKTFIYFTIKNAVKQKPARSGRKNNLTLLFRFYDLVNDAVFFGFFGG